VSSFSTSQPSSSLPISPSDLSPSNFLSTSYSNDDPTSQLYKERDFACIETYFIQLKNLSSLETKEFSSIEDLKIEKDEYFIVRQKLLNYLLHQNENKEEPRTKFPKFTLKDKMRTPSYQFNVYNTTIGDVLLGENKSRKLLNFITSRFFFIIFVFFHVGVAILSFLTLFDILPAIICISASFIFFILLLFFFCLNAEICVNVMKTFDFWYLGTQSILAWVCFGLMANNTRAILSLPSILFFFWIFLLDASPKIIRKYSVIILINSLLCVFLVVLCIHYNYFTNFHNFSFRIGDVEWTTKQVFTSCLTVIVIYLIRCLFYTKFYPNKFLFLSVHLERGGYKKRFLT